MKVTPATVRSLVQEDKIRSYEQMPAIIHELRRAGIYVALAQGVFDIVHVGHVGYLREASRIPYAGGVLIVGIENDEAVKLNKGNVRPINPADDRMMMLTEFTSVRLVFTYPDTLDYNKPTGYIDRYRDLHPHAVVVPSFDPHMELKKWQAAEAGTRLATVHYRHTNSTTRLLDKLGFSE